MDPKELSGDLLDIRVEGADPVVVHVVGEVDFATAPTLEDELHKVVASHESVPLRVAVDLSETSFIDSRGLGALVRVSRIAAETGGSFVLVHPSSMVLRLLALTGLQDILPVKPHG